jgi:formate/nitrite transporter FocA (FNT family)
MEAFMLVVNAQTELWRIVEDFPAPVLLGNIVGGTALFAVISHEGDLANAASAGTAMPPMLARTFCSCERFS